MLALLCGVAETTIAYHYRKDDGYKAYFLAAAIIMSAGLGAVFAFDNSDFLFRFLLLGANIGLVLSALFHSSSGVKKGSRTSCKLNNHMLPVENPTRVHKLSEAKGGM